MAKLDFKHRVRNRLGRPRRRQGRCAERRFGFPGGDLARRHGAVHHGHRDVSARDSHIGSIRARRLRYERRQQRSPRRRAADPCTRIQQRSGRRRQCDRHAGAAAVDDREPDSRQRKLDRRATVRPLENQHGKSAFPGCEIDRGARRDRSPASDLFRPARQLRHARRSDQPPAEPVRRTVASAQGFLRCDGRAWCRLASDHFYLVGLRQNTAAGVGRRHGPRLGQSSFHHRRRRPRWGDLWPISGIAAWWPKRCRKRRSLAADDRGGSVWRDPCPMVRCRTPGSGLRIPQSREFRECGSGLIG